MQMSPFTEASHRDLRHAGCGGSLLSMHGSIRCGRCEQPIASGEEIVHQPILVEEWKPVAKRWAVESELPDGLEAEES